MGTVIQFKILAYLSSQFIFVANREYIDVDAEGQQWTLSLHITSRAEMWARTRSSSLLKSTRVLTRTTSCHRWVGTKTTGTSTSIVAGPKDADAFRSFMKDRPGSVLTDDLEAYNQDWSVSTIGKPNNVLDIDITLS